MMRRCVAADDYSLSSGHTYVRDTLAVKLPRHCVPRVPPVYQVQTYEGNLTSFHDHGSSQHRLIGLMFEPGKAGYGIEDQPIPAFHGHGKW